MTGPASAVDNAIARFNGTGGKTIQDYTSDAPTISDTGDMTLAGNLALAANNITMTGSLGATGARLTKGWFTDLEVTNAIVGSITGLAGTATALATARTIGGVSFDGTANIVPDTIGVVDESADTTCFPLFAISATGSLQPKTGTNLTFNSSTGILTATGFSGPLTGNASTATVLATARTINGVSFDGSANITVTAAAGTLSGTVLKSTVVTSSLTAVGTLTSGNATAIVDAATTTAAGKAELATGAEVDTGTDNVRTITPLGLQSITGLPALDTVKTTLTGVLRADSGVLAVDADVTDLVSAASLTLAGKIEIATIAETNTGTDAARAVSPDGLDGWTGSAQVVTVGTLASGNATAIVDAATLTAAGKIEIATGAETNTGTDATRAVSPDGLNDWTGSIQITTLGTIATGTWQGTTIAVNQGGTGATTLGDGFILLGSGAGAITALDATAKGKLIVGDGATDPIALTVGANDTVLTADSTEASGVKWAAAGGGIDIQTFTGSGTWTKPAGATNVYVTAVGGGGGGGSGRSVGGAGGGSGGGGGHIVSKMYDAADLTATETVVVGAGGAGGAEDTDQDGSAGADSTFDDLTAGGGGGGGETSGIGGDSGVGTSATAISGQGASGVSATTDGNNGEFGGGSGGGGGGTAGNGLGGSSLYSAGGGGRGGGGSGGAQAGSDGGGHNKYTAGGGGDGGAIDTNGTNGGTYQGGGGGGNVDSGTAGNGGTGGAQGGGGGGGGGANAGQQGGGGSGGSGKVWVYAW